MIHLAVYLNMVYTCAPPEHIAIFGACVLLLVLCCSDRDQRVHVSVVVAVIVAFGVVAVSVVRQQPVLGAHRVPAHQESFALKPEEPPAPDEREPCLAQNANYRRFERAERRHHHRPVPVSRTAVYRRGYSMLTQSAL